MKRLLLLPLLCAAQVGCVETVTVRQAVPDSVEALVSVPRQAWRVERGSELVGLVIRFDPAHGDHDRFHSVRNPWNQELGMVDAEGRAWRFRPHGRDPLWLGTGTVADGVCSVLGVDPELCELVATSLERLQER